MTRRGEPAAVLETDSGVRIPLQVDEVNRSAKLKKRRAEGQDGIVQLPCSTDAVRAWQSFATQPPTSAYHLIGALQVCRELLEHRVGRCCALAQVRAAMFTTVHSRADGTHAPRCTLTIPLR